MFSIVEKVGTISKATAKGFKVQTDGVIFKLHYMLTVPFLLAFCVVMTTRQFVGSKIHCLNSNQFTSTDAVDTYCWIHATYTIPDAYNKSWYTSNKQYTGIDGTKDPKKFLFHFYYQWVVFVLLLQAMSFYCPSWLWKIWEGGKVKIISRDLCISIKDEEGKLKKEDTLMYYMLESWGTHEEYAKKYIFCEILALLNVVGQIFCLNALFQGQFLGFGINVIRFAYNPGTMREDPMVELFPRFTMCIFKSYGEAGSTQETDTLCLLPLNIVNEKIFIFLWFWFIILATLSSFSVCECLLLLYFSSFRFWFMKKSFRGVPVKDIRTIVDKGRYGDMFLLCLIGSTVDSIIFKDLVQELAVKLDNMRFVESPNASTED